MQRYTATAATAAAPTADADVGGVGDYNCCNMALVFLLKTAAVRVQAAPGYDPLITSNLGTVGSSGELQPGHMLRVSQICEHPEVIYKNATHSSSGWAEAHMLHGREVRTGEGQPGSLDFVSVPQETSNPRRESALEEADTAAHREGEERGEAGGASLRACPRTGGASPPRPARHRKVF